jgi:hypothetical protein
LSCCRKSTDFRKTERGDYSRGLLLFEEMRGAAYRHLQLYGQCLDSQIEQEFARFSEKEHCIHAPKKNHSTNRLFLILKRFSMNFPVIATA